MESALGFQPGEAGSIPVVRAILCSVDHWRDIFLYTEDAVGSIPTYVGV